MLAQPRWMLSLLCGAAVMLVAPSCNDAIEHSADGGGAIAVSSDAEREPASEQPAVNVTGSTPVAATIAYVGNFRGFQRPCNCSAGQRGGLLRLGTALSLMTDWLASTDNRAAPDEFLHVAPVLALPQPLWVFDLGNFADPTARYPVERAQTHLAALAMLSGNSCRAVVLGSSELQLDAEIALAVLADSPVPLVSCNLDYTLPTVDIQRYIQLAPGWYITGVSSWLPATGEPAEDRWWTLADPVASVMSVLDQLPGDAHVIVATQYQPAEVQRELAMLPVVMLVGYSSENDARWNDVMAQTSDAPPEKGMHLLLASLDTATDAQKPSAMRWQIDLDPDWEDDARIATLIADEQEAVRQRLHTDFNPADTEGWRDVDWGSSDRYLPPEPEDIARTYLEREPEYIGSTTCIECHASEGATWEQSAHAGALVTLVKDAENQNLDCLECHVLGLLEPAGYNPLDPQTELGSVGCESCHGAGSLHYARMILGVNDDDLAILRSGLIGCRHCHDDYDSPDFDPDEYWRRIMH